MEDFLLRLTLDVKVVAPLHIGTGEKLSAKSFVTSDDQVIVADERKLIEWASQDPRRADEFMTFAERTDTSLTEFFKQRKLAPQDYAAYQIANRAPGRPRDVLVFIKTADGQPYLPGSSLKGSVRSAILRGTVLDQPALAERLRAVAEPLTAKGDRHVSDEIEARVFVPAKDVKRGKRQNYDLIRALGLSDSAPVTPDHLQLVQVQVLSSQRNQTLKFKQTPRGDNIMQIYAETIRPGTTLRMVVTLNEALLRENGPARKLRFASRSALVMNFAHYCRIAAANLIDQEIAFYHAHHQSDLEEWFFKRKAELDKLPETAFLLPVGWGTGYDAKTVTDQLGEQVFRSVVSKYRNTKRLGKPGGGGDWLGPDLSPKSRKVVFHTDEWLEPIGWVRIQIQEG